MEVSAKWQGDDFVIIVSSEDVEERKFVLRHMDEEYGDRLITAIEAVKE